MNIVVCLVVMLSVGCVSSAAAQVVEVKVTGQFRPNALDPNNTAFENTTPRGAFCRWRPAECQRRNAYIFDLGSREYWRKSGGGDNAARRDTTYVGFPPPRMVTFTNAANGHSFQARISFVAMALRLNFTNGVDPWYYRISGGCSAIRGDGGLGYSFGGWGVRDPANPQPCYSTVPRNGRTYSYRNLGLGISVDLPNSTSLQDGSYTALEEWTTGGAGADIDLGDNITGVERIRMDFAFDVAHDFQVRFASESPRVQLTPEGGWSRWVDHGLPPAGLRQELPFHLTTSMDFSMKLRCEHVVDDRCGIHNLRDDAVVAVDVDVTLPGMTNLRDGRPAQNTPLLPDDGRAPRFTPDGYLMGRRAHLRFAAGSQATMEMLRYPGSHWSGVMTVVFDANP